MKKIYYYVSLLGLGVLSITTSCKKEKSGEPKSVVLNSNSADLSQRMITYGNEIIPVVEYGSQKTLNTQSSGRISAIDISSDFNLRLIAEVQAPEYNGNTLQATGVAVSGNRAYVSYNTRGGVYLGGIDVIDISDAAQPRLLQNAITPDIDISALEIENNSLYVAGALDIDKFSEYSSPAIASRIGVSGGLLTENIQNVKLGGYVANSISLDGNDLFLTSGNTNGGVSRVDKNSLTVKSTLPLDGAKDVAVGASEYTVLYGAYNGSSKQTLAVYDKSSNQFKRSSDVPAGIHYDAKSNIAVANNAILVSNGFAGITFWNSSSTRLDYIGLPTSIPDVDAADIYTNSVSISESYVYGANGAAGLVVSRINQAGNGLEILGTADVKGSANYVKAANGLIFVASGKGGVQIYKLESKAIEPPTPTTPNCEGRPTLASSNNGVYNNNSGAKEYFKGSTVLGGLNVNALFDFCGSLQIRNNLHVNSNGTLTVAGALSVSKNTHINSSAKVSGNFTTGGLTLNSNGALEMVQSATLKVDGDLTMNQGSILKVRGKLEIDGDFTYNGGRIEFIGSGCSVSIKGKVKGHGNDIVGTYTGKIR